MSSSFGVRCILFIFFIVCFFQGAQAIEVSFSAEDGGESVGISDDYEVSTGVSVSEESEAKFGSVEMTNTREVAGSGDINAVQSYSGSGGYTGATSFSTSGSGSLIGSAYILPRYLNANQRISASGSLITVGSWAADGKSKSETKTTLTSAGGIQGSFDGIASLYAGHSTDALISSHITGALESIVSATGSTTSTRNSNGVPWDADQFLHAQTPGTPGVIDRLTFHISPLFRIQPAIDFAKTGDTVSVPAGFYPEDVNIYKWIGLIGFGNPTANSFSLTNGAQLGPGSGGISAPVVTVNQGSKIQDGILLASDGGIVNVNGGTYGDNLDQSFYANNIRLVGDGDPVTSSISLDRPVGTQISGITANTIIVNPNAKILQGIELANTGATVNVNGAAGYTYSDDLTQNFYAKGITLTGFNNPVTNSFTLNQDVAGKISGITANTVNVLNSNAKIQDSVTLVSSGGTVNVATGTYTENVQIDKSLTVNGVGAGNTIVDGSQAGSVFTIGMNNPNIDVTLSSLTAMNGKADYGGGIVNQGTLTLTDVSLTDNTANEDGGGILSLSHGIVNMDGSSITGNSAHEGGGIYSYGTVTMNDGSIKGNTADYGGGIFKSGSMTMNGGSITGNTATQSGGGIYSYGIVTMNGGSITGNRAGLGGGILNYGSMTMNGGGIIGNIATIGGGILNGGTVNMNGGSINRNAVYWFIIPGHNDPEEGVGGGIFNGGTVNMNGGSINGNTANEDGAGIYNYQGTVTMNGGSITGNRAAIHGGGIFNAGTVTMNGGSITENKAYQGGGIYSYGTVTMNDGSINGNTADYGGGIFKSGSMTMNGGSITGNTATQSGGGILNSGIVTMNGGSITGNTANYGGGIYNGGTVTVTGGSITRNSAISSAYSGGYGGGIYNGGTVTVTGGSITRNSAISSAYSGGYGGGIDNHGTVIMNDCSITENKAYQGGGINNEGTVTMNVGSITGNTANGHRGGGGIYNEGTVTMDGGSITGNTALFGGGISNKGTVSLDGVSITGNKAYEFPVSGHLGGGGDGGGICNLYGTLTMNGGSITGNIGRSGGGIYSNGGTLTMNGCSITGNTAAYRMGGGIANGGTLTMNGCSITGNTAVSNNDGRGGGIENGGILTMNGCSITGNTAINGGGIENERTVTMNGCSITGNTAINGGGIYNERTVTMNGGSITRNTASQDGGGIFSTSWASAIVNLNEGSISGNTACYGRGGGIYSNLNSQVRFDGTQVVVKSNKAHLPLPSELSWYQGWGVYLNLGTPTTTGGFDPVTQVTDNTNI